LQPLVSFPRRRESVTLLDSRLSAFPGRAITEDWRGSDERIESGSHRLHAETAPALLETEQETNTREEKP